MVMARYEFDPELCRVWIDGSSTIHPLNAEATGLSGWAELDVVKGKVVADSSFDGEVRIEVSRLTSGNALVDRETQRRIDARRHPEIVGTVLDARVDKNQSVNIEGSISFRGETSRVKGTVTAVVDGTSVTFEGAGRFDVRDWGLKPPKIGLVRVHPDVDVRIHLVGHRAE